MQNNKTSLENTDRGVEYYNIKITKREHKDNIIEMGSVPFSSSPEAIASDELLSSSPEDCHSGEAQPQVSHCADAHPTPQEPTPHDLIKNEMVKRCLVQLFKNDDRYKLKIRINALMNGENVDIDFIAPLTQDRRNFKKYMPEECGDWFIDWSDTQVKSIKELYGVKAYRGKFHEAQSFKAGRKTMTQIEPWCQCVVWYNPETKAWSFLLNIYDFVLFKELQDQGITPAQKKSNLHRQELWINPLHDTRSRPKTWAERMGMKK
jgi:hypothetical protein